MAAGDWIYLIINALDYRPAALSAVGGSQKMEEKVHANISEGSSSCELWIALCVALCLALWHTRCIARAGCRCDYGGASGVAGV
jgi:hypothetical protein